MKQTKLYLPMVKDINAKAVAISHIYGIKAGLFHQNAAGIYSYLPVGTAILNKIEAIIDQELVNIGANKVKLPVLEDAKLWEKSGRLEIYGPELMRINDRKRNLFILGPTHEELISILVKNHLKSYKDYPLNLYQIGSKFRDELRPRFGLLRSREFIMMDAYSFHLDMKSLDETYQKYLMAYEKIFTKLNLDYKIVEANNGTMGGNKSHEFMVLADIGEDTIVYEKECKKAYNLEIAPIYYENQEKINNINSLDKVYTPEKKTILQLSEFLEIAPKRLIKTLLYEVDKQVVMVLIRGDREANETKIANFFTAQTIKRASQDKFLELNLIKGFIGPIGLTGKIEIVADTEVQWIIDGVLGANQNNYHYKNVDFKRDLDGVQLADLRMIEVGDKLRKNGQEIFFAKAIEVGHIFALGDKYTKSLDIEYVDQNQNQNTPVMGCYGIGVSRLISAIIEQHYDQKGMILPSSISPFQLHILALDYQSDNQQRKYVDDLENQLQKAGYQVLVDDRDKRSGVKFGEADLIGFPIQIIVGKNYLEQKLELKIRKTNQKLLINENELMIVLATMELK